MPQVQVKTCKMGLLGGDPNDPDVRALIQCGMTRIEGAGKTKKRVTNLAYIPGGFQICIIIFMRSKAVPYQPTWVLMAPTQPLEQAGFILSQAKHDELLVGGIPYSAWPVAPAYTQRLGKLSEILRGKPPSYLEPAVRDITFGDLDRPRRLLEKAPAK